ncbi:MAG: hypothetical protein QMD22_10115 [archaeon]|nr:hypothetical protein [archaeon]
MSKKGCKISSIGVWDLFGSIGIYLDLGFSTELNKYHISIPIAICLFAMIYPIMVQISFGEVKKALSTPKPIATTLFMNWAIKPFTMAFFAWLFLSVVFSPFLPQGATLTPLGEIPLIRQYMAGLILLGVAPCTAMVPLGGWMDYKRSSD